MDPRLQNRVQRYGWDRAVADYERSWQRQLAPAHERLLAMAELTAGESVLDIACGTGLVSFPAAAAVTAAGSVVGTDISDGMVEASRQVARRRSLGHASFERMEAEALTFGSDRFDAVLCALGLMYVTDFQGSVQEMARVAKPGGRVVAAVWGARDACGWADIFPIVDERVNTEVCPLFFQLGSGDLLAKLFVAAGLEDVRSERILTQLEYATEEEACIAAFAGGPVAMAYSRFDVATREAAHADYLASIAAYRNDGIYRIPGEFVVTRGTKPSA